MRVQESFVDYNHVHPEHEAIHARLENWRRWVTVRPHGWQTAPMFRMYQSKARHWHAPVIQNPVDTLDALKIERAVSRLPIKTGRQSAGAMCSQATRLAWPVDWL